MKATNLKILDPEGTLSYPAFFPTSLHKFMLKLMGEKNPARNYTEYFVQFFSDSCSSL